MSHSETVELKVPDLGDEVDEVTIVTWLKAAGDSVVKDEAVLEVMTDKANIEVESPKSGVIIEILYEIDDVVKTGTVIAKIETA